MLRANVGKIAGMVLTGVLVCVPLAAQQNGRSSVLIGFRQTPGPAEQALVRGAGGTIRYTYSLIPAIAAQVPEAALDGLRRNPLVTVIEPDGQVTANAQTVPWGVTDIGAVTVHATNTGNGIKVCILDSGISTTHEDLQPNYVAGYDYVNGDAVPEDQNGHGTHVAGTIGGRNNSLGVLGVAPNVDLAVFKVLDSAGNGSFSDIIQALQACTQLFPGQLKITNNSYGSTGDPGTLVKAAFDNSYAQGVLHIAAAGNSGKPSGQGNTIGYPARYSSVVAVTAVDINRQRPYWSSYGDEAEVSAPGVNIVSTYPPSQYASMNGTSMASPHVAGVAALVAGACGLASPAQIRQRLRDTASDLGSAGWDKFHGYGYVRANLAASCAPATPEVDLSVSFVSPPSAVTEGSATSIVVRVQNIGTLDSGGFSVTLHDGSTLAGSQASGGLNAGASAEFTFAWTPVGTGLHTLTAAHTYTDKTGDSNDSASTAVNVNPPGGSFTLSAVGYKVRGAKAADLSWSGSAAGNVDIYRNGSVIATVASSGNGTYSDVTAAKGGGTTEYRVCNAGTSTCSNNASVTY